MSSLRAFLHRTLPQVWQRRGWAARLLWPLSRLYALAWRRRQRRAMQANTPHLPVPVHQPLIGRQPFERDGSAGVEAAGGYADFCAKAKFAAVGKLG